MNIIGEWIRRVGKPDAKWHKVESVIAGDAITRCGKRMKDPGLETYQGAVSRANVPLTDDLCRGGCR